VPGGQSRSDSRKGSFDFFASKEPYSALTRVSSTGKGKPTSHTMLLPLRETKASDRVRVAVLLPTATDDSFAALSNIGKKLHMDVDDPKDDLKEKLREIAYTISPNG